jgi:hypothetical protein
MTLDSLRKTSKDRLAGSIRLMLSIIFLMSGPSWCPGWQRLGLDS